MRAGDLATAQSFIDAAGITVPTGDLCQGCYDEQGVLYRLPQCIVSDPENIVRSDQEPDDFDTDDGKLSSDEASGDELIADDIERRRDEKGKTSERDLIRIRARLSDRGGPDIILSVVKTMNVGSIARKVQQEAGVRQLALCFIHPPLKQNLDMQSNRSRGCIDSAHSPCETCLPRQNAQRTCAPSRPRVESRPRY